MGMVPFGQGVHIVLAGENDTLAGPQDCSAQKVYKIRKVVVT